MGRIPEEIIAQVIDRCDIVEIISSYIPLKRAGRNFKALCPFHHEKTPSFVINPDKQIFHCFGCAAGGNVVSFVMKQETLEFPEAIRQLASRVNIEIPLDGEQDNKQFKERQAIFQVNALAAEYFHKNLLSDKSQLASQARRYMKGRGITVETVKQFKLGFALDQWDALIQSLSKEGTSMGLMEKAGLAIPREKKDGYYDRFRNRITFPIFDTRANCRAFGARTMEDESGGAKYINSPETIVYTKGHHLYGFHAAKQAITQSDQVVIVEGYMDCLIPYQAGIHNVVASLGTALTVEQIRLLKRYTKNIVMLFDMDQAGQAAMIRSLDVLIAEGMDVKVASLDEGKDPDSFVREHGVAALRERIDDAEALVDYKIKYFIGQFGIRTPEAKAKVAAAVLPTIRQFDNEVLKSEYIKKLAQILSLPEQVLLSEVDKVQVPREAKRGISVTQANSIGSREERVVEHNMLKLLLDDESYLPKMRGELAASDFQDGTVRNIISKIFDIFDHGQKVDLRHLVNSFQNDQEHQVISRVVASEEAVTANKDKMYTDYIRRIKTDSLKLRRQQLLGQIQQAEKAGDAEKLKELSMEFDQLIRQ